MTRRHAIWLVPLSAGALALLWRRETGHGPLPSATASVSKVVRSEADWWGRLTPQQFYVTRTGTTEEPFSGDMHRLKDAGVFQCVCCDAALFSSRAKYDSGTGWPSFREPVGLEVLRIVEVPGLGTEAALASGIEVLCVRCDAHLGHIFGDGPSPGGLRYCINESALRFVPSSV